MQHVLHFVQRAVMASKDSQMVKQPTPDQRTHEILMLPQKLKIIRMLKSGKK
jgi:hypothetical protein